MEIETVRPVIGMMARLAPSDHFLYMCHAAALEQGFRFFTFHPSAVDASERRITGKEWKDGKWVKGSFPYPDVIYDRYRRIWKDEMGVYPKIAGVPTTHALIRPGRKSVYYRLLSRSKELAPLLIPYLTAKNPSEMIRFTDEHERVLLKPESSKRGKQIVFITKDEDGYVVDDQRYEHRMSREELEQLLHMFSKECFTMQKVVNSRTKEGIPFSLRIHLLKDGTGQWVIGVATALLSLTPHIQVTNHLETFRGFTPWKLFRQSQYSQAAQDELDARIEQYSLAVAKALEAEHGSGFHEIGLDLGIDEAGRIFSFEANIGDIGVKYHELETARYGIAYAAYVAKQAARNLSQKELTTNGA